MDSTLFDYKSSSQQEVQRGARANSKPQQQSQRPMSAQNQKFSYHALSPTTHESYQNGPMPQITGNNRVRPTTAANRQGANNGYQSEMGKPFPHSIMEELLPEEEDRLVEKAAYAEPVQLPDFQKIMPRNITLEKERLYEDTLHLKQLINALREENLKVKTRNLNVERENAKLVKSLEKLGSNAASYGKPVESALIVTLKKQVKELRDELKVRQDEIEFMKRSTKVTKFQELDCELRTFIDENIRLKNKFEELKNSKPQIKPEDYNALEERYLMQTSLIETLQRDHARLSADIKYLEDENYRIQLAKDQETANNQKQHTELVRLRKQLKDAKTQLSAKLDITNMYNKTSNQKNDDKTSAAVNDLKKKLAEKEQSVTQKDRIIIDLQQKLNEKDDNDEDKNIELVSLKQQYTELESKYKALQNANRSTEEKRALTTDQVPERRERPKTADPKDKAVKKFSSEDVLDIGYELSIKLRLRGIPIEDVMNLLDQCGPRLSIYNMKEILQHGESFNLKDEDAALLVARYLIDANAEKSSAFDGNKTQDVKNIKNTFKGLVSNYALLDEDEASMMDSELSDAISKYGQTLRAHFSTIPEAKTGFLSHNQITQAFADLEIDLSEKTLDYLIMNLYEYTNNVKKMSFMKMFEIFELQTKDKSANMYEDDEEDSQPSERKVKFAENNRKEELKKDQGVANSNPKAAKHEQEEEEDEEDYDLDDDDEDYGEDENDREKGKAENDNDDDGEYDDDYEN